MRNPIAFVLFILLVVFILLIGATVLLAADGQWLLAAAVPLVVALGLIFVLVWSTFAGSGDQDEY